MILIPYSFAGTSLNSTDYETFFPDASLDAQIKSQAGYVKRAGAYPVYAGKDIVPQTLLLNILMLHDHQLLLEDLNALFDTTEETPQQLICRDSQDSDKQYYVYATPQQVLGGGAEGNMAKVILALDDPVWQTVTQLSQTWSTTSSTSTTDVTVGGNADAYPLFEITPTASPTTDFIYSVMLQVLPQSIYPWGSRPVCITGATDTTFDTAALVTAGKMTTDGADLRVYRDGVEDNFWMTGFNTTDTKIWVTADMPEARNMLLKTAIGATDTVTEIELVYNTSNLTAFNACPLTGRLIIDTTIGSTDTEEFSYTNKRQADNRLFFTIAGRAARNTTAVAHAANSNVRFHPYTWRLNYGKSGATAQAVDDTKKPLIDLTNSNNASFVYSTFHDVTNLRGGEWNPFVRSLSDPVFSRSGTYTSTSDEGDTDPATTLGLAAKTYERGGLWRPDSVSMAWSANFPDYVTSFSASGEQSQNAANLPSVGMTYVTSTKALASFFWTLSQQATTDFATWTAWSKATTDATVPPAVTNLVFAMLGTVSGSTDVYFKAGVTSATVNLTNPVHVMIRPELTTTARINCTIANTTTGDTFDLVLPVEVNDTVYVDCNPDFPNVTYSGQVVNGAIRLSSVRSVWMKFAPGSNTLTFDNAQSVANDISIVIKWRERASFF